MCGIVGYVGGHEAAPIILEGLGRLAYRGYDSAGLAVLGPNGPVLRRSVGKLENLSQLLNRSPAHGSTAIGHTRWATHGGVTEYNAHPHVDCRGQVIVAQNGIVENYASLKQRLLAEGHAFLSQTDTEVIAHLVEDQLAAGHELPEAVSRALALVEGANSVVVLAACAPDRIVAARLGHAGGLAVGLGDGETLVASDMPAILARTQRVVFLENRELAVLRSDGASYYRLDGTPLHKPVATLAQGPDEGALGPHAHYMKKEIYEQPRSAAATLHGRVDWGAARVTLPEVGLCAARLRRLRRVHAVACGTAWHAALVGKFMIEQLAHIPVEVDYGSEFRYRQPLLDADDLVLAITQSGETADTLAALEEAREHGAATVSIVNAVGSQAARLAGGALYLNAGPEIGVASTKAFTCMLVAQYLLAIYLGQERGLLGQDERAHLLADLSRLPELVGEALADDSIYQDLADRYRDRRDSLYLGRGINYPIALEGALKLKEISYIHAEGYPAGEMKHGPIALVDSVMPVVSIVARGPLHDKMLSNVEQIKARGGLAITVAAADDAEAAARADHLLPVSHLSGLLDAVLNVIPLQLLAYHMALARGCDVDQPRNLAKSVTVE